MQSEIPFSQRVRDAYARNWQLFYVCLMLATVLPVSLLMVLPKKYEATASTRVVKDELAVDLGLATKTWSSITAAEAAANQFRDLASDDRPGGFLDSAIKRAKLEESINLDPSVDDPRLKQLRKALNVYPGSAEVFVVSLTWDREKECERLLQAMQEQFIESTGQAKHAKSDAMVRFLDKEIADYEGRMRTAESALINYKQANFGNLPETEGAEIKQLGQLRMQMDDLRVRSQDSQKKRQALKARLAQINPQSVEEQTFEDDPRAVQLRTLETERELLLVEYLPNSDEVKNIDQRIAAIKRALKPVPGKDTKNVVQTRLQLNPEHRNLMQQLTEAEIAQQTQAAQMQLLQKQINEYTSRIRRMPNEQRALNDRTRDYSILKTQYEELLKQREQARTKGNLDGLSARSELAPLGVVYARSTTRTSKLAVMIAACCMLGLLVSVGMVALREWSDPAFYYAPDAERYLGVPVVASLAPTALSSLPSGAQSIRRQP